MTRQMKLIQGGKRTAEINEPDWRFIRQSLNQCLATQFITEAEKSRILQYLERSDQVELVVRSLMTASQSVTSFVLSLLQAADNTKSHTDESAR